MTTNQQPEALTGCGDKQCPSRSLCKRYAARHASGMADFNREENAEKCEYGFIPKEP